MGSKGKQSGHPARRQAARGPAEAAGEKAGATASAPARQESAWRRFNRWSGIADPDADARLEDPAAATAGARRGPTWLPIALLVGLYGLAVLVYILLGRGQELPQVSPDEYQYSALARSVADGNGLTYNGGPISGGLRAALYIYAIAPAWIVTDSLTQAYAIAKALGAIMICTVVFPTWLLGRRYMPPLVALVPAVLIVAGSWMTSAGQMIMENLALPLATAALAALVVALARPGTRWIWISLAFALLAAWSRAQLAMLVPIILLVLVADIALAGRDWRARLRPNRWLLGVVGAVTVVAGIAILAKPSVLGSYVGLKSATDLGRALPLVGRQSLAFIAMSAILPFILAVAVTLRRRAWDPSRLRDLLLVFWVSTVVFVIATGVLTTAFQGVDWSIQRYVEYTLPLLYVLVVAGIWQGLIATRLVAIVTAAVAGVLLLTPQIQNIQEQRGSFGIIRRADQLLGASPGLAMAAVAVLVGGVLVVVLWRGRAARTIVLTSLVVLTGLVFAVQDQAGWDWQQVQSQVWRDGFPEDVSWIDHATDEDLARMVIFYNPYRTPQTEFFNRRITRTYVPDTPVGGSPVNGFTCKWTAQPSGAIDFSPKCGPAPTAFFQNDDYAKVTFHNQKVVAQKAGIGRVVTVAVTPPAKPRFKAVINPFCLAAIPTQDLKTGDILPPRALCGSAAQGTMYLDKPGTLTLRFRGGATNGTVTEENSWGGKATTVTVPAGKPASLTFEVPSGAARQWRAAGDWQGSPPQVPALTSVVLDQGGTKTELLY